MLAAPELHTVALFTPEGDLVCYASDPSKTKDHVRVLVGLSTETWQETRESKIGMVECELGNVLVLPIGSPKQAEGGEPPMLLALNADSTIPFNVLEAKGRKLVELLEKPIAQLNHKLAVPSPPASPRGSRSR
ncbi:hypothetical protein BN946_scf185007.g193 [Trametes cinnabarina]|uniref:Uncharacterized protein n=1 Tax=Pycnoporus cinnabarinus TaxID=5643 RepID=A0A060SL20_PYCCI|nr:hypothetical protein BN946_scf185007.g193 [Trametes cinnabarina]